ncbi:MAG: DUF2442 domain-containing protein [Ignavibacteria bacterium]|nr:DUF2442 domain-containing protein [Ignavibacteria bacterium]MCC7159670.1 DUF2442 domain-containing protein [Ignavibacteria bacterium]
MLVKKLNQSTLKSKSNPVPLVKMTKVDFVNDLMKIYLQGGRVLTVPVNKFPEIKKLKSSQRKSYHIAGGISLDFDDSDEVYHVNELLGIEVN